MVSRYRVEDLICNFFMAVKSIDRRAGRKEDTHEITLLICPRSNPDNLMEITLPVSKLANGKWIAERLGGKYSCYSYKELKRVIDLFAEYAPESTLSCFNR